MISIWLALTMGSAIGYLLASFCSYSKISDFELRRLHCLHSIQTAAEEIRSDSPEASSATGKALVELEHVMQTLRDN